MRKAAPRLRKSMVEEGLPDATKRRHGLDASGMDPESWGELMRNLEARTSLAFATGTVINCGFFGFLRTFGFLRAFGFFALALGVFPLPARVFHGATPFFWVGFLLLTAVRLGGAVRRVPPVFACASHLRFHCLLREEASERLNSGLASLSFWAMWFAASLNEKSKRSLLNTTDGWRTG